ncbi:hypothetical protein BYT27DRAFT_7216321 [Phlegmacium glaucopus]|nr:hypothetical protein BYT27DRAFT_7216321 [Phlegmacium glaucopus]
MSTFRSSEGWCMNNAGSKSLRIQIVLRPLLLDRATYTLNGDHLPDGGTITICLRSNLSHSPSTSTLNPTIDGKMGMIPLLTPSNDRAIQNEKSPCPQPLSKADGKKRVVNEDEDPTALKVAQQGTIGHMITDKHDFEHMGQGCPEVSLDTSGKTL